jgi:uncharacterized protein
MERAVFLATTASSLTVLAIPKPALASESEVELQTATGSLFGTLAIPTRTGKVPVFLIVAGSGAIDRNGNAAIVQSNTYELLASGLVARGCASLRYDKRGVGASRKALTSEERLRFEDVVADAGGWLGKLRSDKRFSNVIVAGHSEGSLTAILAAQQAPVDGIVSLEGAGRPAATILREQLKPKLTPETYEQVDAVITELQHGKLVPGIPETDLLFRPSIQPYLISWFKYDPAAELAKLQMPATIVQGTADVQVSVEDAKALANADPRARLVIVEGMNHMLKHAPDTSSQTAILNGYQNSALPIDPKAMDAVTNALQ